MANAADDPPFWKRKTLAEMTRAEWESLCDGCGRCCLNKLEYEDTGEIAYTDVGCRLLDGETCRCRDYPNRRKRVANCDRLTPGNIRRLNWLPATCGYRLIDAGRDLYWWHPLVSGDPETVHAAGVSVRGRVAVYEHQMGEEELEDRVVTWPTRIPRKARAAPRKAVGKVANGGSAPRSVGGKPASKAASGKSAAAASPSRRSGRGGRPLRPGAK